MRRDRPTIPPRKPFFLGCEGQSEEAYGQFLSDLARDLGLPIYLRVVKLGLGAGDPLSRLQRAREKIEHHERTRTRFAYKAVLLDSDQIDNNLQARERAEQTARKANIEIIWQVPCHEALLLRHFEGFEQRHPVSKTEIEAALRRAWPLYEKPMTRQQISNILKISHVRRAAQNERPLLNFLRRLGIAPP